MRLSRLTDPNAVERAIDEYEAIGGPAFLAKYKHDRNKGLVVVRDGHQYDSKAIFGAAWGYQFPEEGALAAGDFSGGYATVVKYLTRLGFEVIDLRASEGPAPEVSRGHTYTWEDLGRIFGFKPAYLSVAGGMISRPAHNAVLVITHQGGAKSFDYDDYWDGHDLIYTGRGKHGNQELEGANTDVADNRRTILAFEQAGPSQLTYLGSAYCVEWWPDTGPDDAGDPRRIYRFRLRFESPTPTTLATNGEHHAPAAPLRRARTFDKSNPPSSYRNTHGRTDPEETRALQEKATQEHHRLLVELASALEKREWTEIQEIPAAVDLWARPPDASLPRVLFEAKTTSPRSSASRLRAALGQLLEYRFFWGNPDDQLCVVTSGPPADERIRFLRTLEVDVIWLEDRIPTTRGESPHASIRDLTAQ